MLTRDQLKTLHAMFGKLKKLRPDVYDDNWLRILIRNAGGVKPDVTGHVSTKSLTNIGLEDVLEIIEQELERNGDKPGTYWRDTVSRRKGFASRPQVYAINELLPQVAAAVAGSEHAGSYSLTNLCRKWSNGNHSTPDKLTPNQARQLIEMMKEVIARSNRKQVEANNDAE